MKTHTRTALIWAICSILCLTFNACTNVNENEPESNQLSENAKKRETRASSVMSRENAIEFATNYLGLSADESSNCEVFEVFSDSSDKSSSAIMAYAVNFGNGKGHVIVATDPDIRLQIARLHHGIRGFSKAQISDAFVSNLKKEMTEQKYIDTDARKSKESEILHMCHHWYSDRFINIKVNEKSPFNQYVAVSHPGCNAGTWAASCAVALPYSMDDLIYKNAKYDFPSIRYCLEQGEGFSPFPPISQAGLNLVDNDNNIIGFMYSYNGAVSAMATLMRDIGNAINTNYNTKNSTAKLSDVYNLVKSLGVETTQFHNAVNYDEFLKVLIPQKHLIVATFVDKTNGEKYCGIIEGGEIIYGEGSSPYNSNTALVMLYRLDTDKKNDNYYIETYKIYRYPEDAEFKEDLEFKEFFGIRMDK